MIRKLLLPVLAVGGIAFAIYTVRASAVEVKPAEPIAQPATSTFASYVAGAGLVEASTENLAIGTLVPGVVVKLHVDVGSEVKKGDPLFKVDSRDLDAELAVREVAVLQAQRTIDRLKQQPRAEDLPPLEANVAALEATRSNAQRELDRLTRLGGSAGADELDRARWNLIGADARLEQSKAELARIKAGAWKPDIDIAEAQLKAAQKQVEAIRVEIERRIVRSPIDGTVLQLNIREGEYAPAGTVSTPLMLLGDIRTMHIRVDVDENDAWRVQPNRPARASIRGNSDLATDLRFVRIEPFVIPKRSLTGESSERVDTRVLQIIYAFDAKNLPVYTGQQMDVFIEAADARATR